MGPPQPAPPAAPKSSVPLIGHLISLDTTLSRQLHSLTQPVLPSSLLLLLELSADFRLFFPISLSLLLSPSLLRPFLPPLLLGLLLDLALIGLVKLLFRRSRPPHNHTHSMNVAVSADHFSFPSGHASRVCFVASLAHLSAAAIRQGHHEASKTVNFVLLVVWVWAVLTSVSRVLLGRHFVSDVFVGACLGVLEAVFSFRFLKF
ncbi:probable lipid phosphate phosphatase beta [Juglans regia]|uniref:Probable lipid phosphate phosphatase beta n=1 Tax=Juglans regia TaxID=51240 RepID=A0A2I4H3A5_JUGRE|nr:probable lipid phosphate phosphatase beta [Juglans regia]XP_018850639.1 probable lipid phosphate phosphatase beta [Juglans regia]XP_018850641.1 probable lipid phosphate phosphatase beta [Juglans regia]